MLRAIANAGLGALRRCLFPRAMPAEVRRVCIYRIGNIGDTVCAVPAMYAIRRAFPKAEMVLVTSPGARGMPGAAELLGGVSWLSDIAVYYREEIGGLRGRLRWIAELRRRHFDVWIELPVENATFRILVRNMIAARAAGARWGRGWLIDRTGLLARAQSEVIRFPTETVRLLALAAELGIPMPEPARAEFPLELGAVERRAADTILAARGIEGAPMVALAPGAKREPNRWPAMRFTEVGRHLAARGFQVVLLGGPGDTATCASIAQSIGAGAVSLVGATSIRESCEMLRRCELLVCNDSGVQHLAAAVGTPCVSIFSCRDFLGKWFPHGAAHIVLRKWVACHTCLLDHCPYDNRCIGMVAAGEVIAAADAVIARASDRVAPRSPSLGYASSGRV
jgi:lipopolysaccharide heptosyltransferase II